MSDPALRITDLAFAFPGAGWSLVRREFPTAIGPVDLLCRDSAGASVAVEIKRRGEIDGVDRKSTRLNSSHVTTSRMPSSA